MPSILEAALDYVRGGLAVIPLHYVSGPPTGVDAKGKPTGGCSCGQPTCTSQGKHPRDSGWQKPGGALTTAAAVESTFGQGQQPWNVGLVTGHSMWVLDIDADARGGMDSFARMREEHAWVPTTRAHRTGSGGFHLFFAMPPDFVPTNAAKRLQAAGYPGIDVRGRGGQVAAPPSRNLEGEYSVLVAGENGLEQAPDWLLDLLRPPTPAEVAATPRSAPLGSSYVERAVALEIEEVRKSETSGVGRNNAFNASVFSLATMIPHGAITEEQIRSALEPVALEVGLGSVEIGKTLDSAIRSGMAAPRSPWPPAEMERTSILDLDGIDLSADLQAALEAGQQSSAPAIVPPAEQEWAKRSWDDFGNAERFVQYARHRVRWVADAGKWAAYGDDGLWTFGADIGPGEAMRMVATVMPIEAQKYDDDVKDNKDKTERDKFFAWAASQRSIRAVRDCAAGVRNLGVLSVTTNDFDRHVNLLNVTNGVLDLTTGRLGPHDPGLLLRQRAGTAYDPEAKAPMWEAFLERVQPNPEMRRYLQQVIGYTLTGETGEHAVFLHVGETANGKSVMLRVVEAMLGDYSQVVPPSTLVTKKAEQHPTDIARMQGKRMLQMSETAEGARLDEALLKRLSGEETITARGMREDFRDFKSTGKVHLVTNHLPHISGDDKATRRRLHVVTWPVTIPEGERDKKLANKIIANELPGVLAWAVRGAAEWRATGLSQPLQSQMDSADYFDSEDEFGEFVKDCLMITDPTGDRWSSSEAVFQAYLSHCNASNVKPMSKIAFSRKLSSRGFQRSYFKNVRGFYAVVTKPGGFQPIG